MARNANAPNFRERVTNLFNPARADEMYLERMKKAQHAAEAKDAPAKPQAAKPQTAGSRMAATGYGNHGASNTLNSMIGWLAGGGSAEDDIDLQGSTLRVRARDLYAGGGLARSAIDTLTTNTVGWGIQPKPKIDADLLGMSDEAAEEWERNTLREFLLWANSTFCDAERAKDFFTMQQTAFRNQLMSGDVFVLFGMKENPRTPYQTTIRLLEADRISTPESSGDSESKNTDGGGRIVDGIEIDRDGVVTRYHIASRHPLAGEVEDTVTWTAIDAYGKDTGMPNILHLMAYERPEQRRGVPLVAAEMELLKQLQRYLNAELARNVVSSMFTIFITSEQDDGMLGLEEAIPTEDKVTDEAMQFEMGPGTINALPPGKGIETANPMSPPTGFEPFVTAMETVIGAGLEIPKEVLTKKYDSNYTAARSALLDFWKRVRVYRKGLDAQFNQPIYEMWLAEAVSVGRIEANGFFDDPAIRQAWCGCEWHGISMGHVDPIKEVNAAEKRIALNISTQEQEASEYNGNDWSAVIPQRKRELTALVKEQAALNAALKGQTQTATKETAKDAGEEDEDAE